MPSYFSGLKKMYFWLRSATSNIHEAIPQTRGGEGAWGRVADWFDPPLIIHHPLNASKNSKYSPHLSKYSLLNSGWIQNFIVSTQSQDIGWIKPCFTFLSTSGNIGLVCSGPPNCHHLRKSPKNLENGSKHQKVLFGMEAGKDRLKVLCWMLLEENNSSGNHKIE